MAKKIQVVIDCADPSKLAEFWAHALGYHIPDPPGDFKTWPDFLRAQGVPESEFNSASAVEDPDGVGPRVYFQRVPEPKAGKNRLHLDINAGGGRATPEDEKRALVDAAVEDLVAHGATRVEDRTKMGERWVVMADPEGNEFCVQ
ncbi:VOC family protein [Virgisporangium ochraceum]|uniref:Glyoxalase n=1 Tax=Virgisporangium ochraceum TaxID=65505 RepID=A0A8J3ZRB1_9ACTN|nr:VOC family protein [Virgisporangium ochraceum]GIJ68762.1 glyoxalase [Virgisporangium ochraceum]